MNATQSRRGSALLIVIIFVIALTIVTGSVLSLNLNEQQRIVDKDLLIKSRYGAEAVLEYGAAQLRKRFDASAFITQTDIDTTPLRLPPSSFFPASSGIDTGSLSLTIRVGARNPVPVYISPANPNNRGDPLVDRNVFTQPVRIYATATARDPSSGRTRTSYSTQTLVVRDAPPTSGAIHYLPNCEISPGADMGVFGPVYCYGSIWMQTSASLTFNSSVRARGDLIHGPLATGKSVDGGTVKIKEFDDPEDSGDTNRFWELKYTSGSRTFAIDSRTTGLDLNGDGSPDANTDWATLAQNQWDGNVQTQVRDTSDMNPFSFPTYQPNNPTAPVLAEQDEYNASYDLIRPAMPTTDPRYPVVPATPVAPSDPGYAAYQKAVELKNIELQKFQIRAGLFIEVTASATPVVNAYTWVEDPTGIYERRVEDRLVGTNETRKYRKEPVIIPAGVFSTTTIPDYRRGASIAVVNIDISKLNALIRTPGTTAADKIGNFSVTNNWNGVVYVQNKTATNSGVRLINSRTLPSAGTTPGFTLATNSPLYIKGNYNADGANTTDAAIRTPDAGEVPAALVSDAITFLSNSWSDAYTTSTPIGSRTASTTEVAAAIMTGIVPTKGNEYSGGVENLPRFLENWSGKVFGYRGSMLVFFQSEVATQKWPGTGVVYNPPTRTWGYSSMFASGVVVPGFPFSRDYRRASYRDITKSAYETGIAP